MGDILGAIGNALLEFVLPTLATAIATLVVGILTRFLKKQKIDITDAQQKRLKEIVEDAIKAVEEAAHRETMTSAQKESMAKQIILERTAAEPGVPVPEPEKLSHAIDAAMPEIRKRLEPSTPATFGRQPQPGRPQ